ncbi:anti-sigma regulatory factor [Natronosporangium hydrolyticum]|uniref:Anti-sigma regulatory factor n=1 Tax=Natronosporangium hydrolyticum TaxID=2811111 RepID=A0A895YA87_9ACTN|nr:anti-sigma regulatory factor [Natronosporangium hydrolyticum]QSB13215.1 anti-sigma regulatory factor [Natronosporangium hydrolyticum]
MVSDDAATPVGAPLIVPITVEEHLRTARHAVRAAAQRLKLRLVDQTKLVTAASELARNCYIHAGGGELTIEEVVRDDHCRGIRLTFEDSGPGIPDPEAALLDGFSTGGGLGHGLGGARRLMDEFTITTSVTPPTGTAIVATRWVR